MDPRRSEMKADLYIGFVAVSGAAVVASGEAK